MNSALTVVRLRWALTIAAMRKSSWQLVGYIFSLLIGLSMVVGIGVAAWFLGTLDFQNGHSWNFRLLYTIIVLGGAVVGLLCALVQVMLIGEGSTLNPKKFALFGIPDRTLQSGLTLAGLSGIPAISGLLSLLLLTLAYRHLGIGMMVVSVIAAPLTVITIMSVSKLVISLASTMMHSRRSQAVLYIVVMVVIVGLSNTPNIIINSGDPTQLTLDPFTMIARVFSWTPFGAPFQLPFDAQSGDWLALVARVLIIAATWAVCFLGGVWCLSRDRKFAGKAEQAKTLKGIGPFSWMPNSTSGAVSARLLSYLRRDPRQAMFLLFPLIFLILFALQSGNLPELVWMAPAFSALFLVMAEANGLAYDGRGFIMQAIIGVSGRDDRTGRVRVYCSLGAVYLLLTCLVSAVVARSWTSSSGVLTAVVVTGCSLGLFMAGLGIAEIFSCIFMYPVASMDKPFSSPQGRALAQGFFPFIHMFACIAAMLPTGIVAIVLAVTSVQGLWWILAPVALANGVLFLYLGVLLGGKLMDARLLKIVSTLDGFASLQK
ncbi:ABC transporter permease [Bifidobacterium crudilactis]|jgi:ABC-2 type transport system permease protein|uniref:ABC transporter permease n=1 Tax=Bifidobacterium crudilactis TaxID=327277 RepID=UPI002354A2B8|nr:ABC transporter permease [Bifidobacterium crudilactis]MCI1218109.1 ABC transporter permease [Bifidobacterium crudilactis]